MRQKRTQHVNNQRTESREERNLPLQLGAGIAGTTRNVSPSGIYFESESEQVVGAVVSVTIDFDTPGGPISLKCRGQVVRTERHGNRVGAALKILESKFEAGRERPAAV